MKAANTLTSMFGRSPFKPLQGHMGIVNECVKEVPALFEALIADDRAELERVSAIIFEREQSADDIKNEMRIRLPQSLFMPVDRRDLLELLDVQDSIADTAQDIAGLLMERKMVVPEDMVENLRALVQRCVDSCAKANEVINGLGELLETGFRGRDADRVERMVNELNQIEDETDKLGMSLAQSLFAQEDRLSPVSVVFWYQLIQWIGDLADHSEKVGNLLRLLIAR
ncbi:TIGR00153 family protein [Thiorhodococcus mannitoliphagus]|uniref:TIGR00153 family protein n=1 Tax=Thiorhodococcus mannitoliphagus TaxID=329406 RepID=A0A6P1E329_9GAMM|nr:TIGR00153 family protein [Thiorhodococcus mannitoliphagus]NEX23593.1 TIGR00153 family protein [Thiorhodococcus mannitoliphagus]